MAKKSNDKTIRVGLLVSGALLMLMVFLFLIGSEQKIFARKNEYEVRLENVSGLSQGNPVRMSGVTIGTIRDIKLPQDPKQKQVEIVVMIDRKYGERVRGDSRVRLKKQGLLTGDTYIDVTPGTPRFPALEAGSMIPSQKGTDVEALITSGEDLMENLVQISYSLKNVLGRVERGEGLLGELTTQPETKQRITDTFLTTLNKTNAALTHMETGRGVVGKLIYDDAYAEQLTASISGAAQSMQSLTANIQRSFESGNGLVPAMLNDPEAKTRIYEVIDNLRTTSASLSTFTSSMQTGQGLVPRLMNDREYGDQALNEFSGLVRQLNQVVTKINTGEGTAGKLLSDPSMYESINDILIGINESRLLRWLIRSRQQAGIERRVEDRKQAPNVTPPPAGPPPPDATPAPVESVLPSTLTDPAAVPPTDTAAPPTDTTETQ
ncbi:MAG TPA: MlaD family protein [Thermoanaerobaculia bacterium]|jgi:phospholipid/cholesterol/gamma-HCH transport system substrate-binding protein